MKLCTKDCICLHFVIQCTANGQCRFSTDCVSRKDNGCSRWYHEAFKRTIEPRGVFVTVLNEVNIVTSVCQRVMSTGWGGVCLSACWDTPPGRHNPWADTSGQTPTCQVHAGIHTPPTPCALHAGIDMATAADSTHPTGMHSCLGEFWLFFTEQVFTLPL